MDVSERIQRRRNGRTRDAIVVEWDALNPACHCPDPVGRAATVEALLDAVDPIFEDVLPPDIYVWGEAGTGKSALVAAVMSAMESEFRQHPLRYTANRARGVDSEIQFVYVDGWQTNTCFKLYHRMLDALRAENIPKRGIGTDDLLSGVKTELQGIRGLVLAVDHISMPGSVSMAELNEFLAPLDAVSTIAIGRESPDALGRAAPVEDIHVPPYGTELIDVLSVRASRGLSRALGHPHLRRIAHWADGNAHDALAALYLAALAAHEDDGSRIGADHVSEAIELVPRDGTTLSHVLALSETEQDVLERVIRISRQEAIDIDNMADRIATDSDLTDTTVKRLLYELAQDDVLQRVELRLGEDLVGRRPSQVEPNFAVPLFEHVREA